MPEEEIPGFDERDEVDFFGPPLPPEDRLWRHPSELVAGSAQPGQAGHASVSRHRAAGFFGTRQNTRAGALSAGLAGAMLATGLVLVGTHLAVALSGPGSGPSSAQAGSLPTTTAAFHKMAKIDNNAASTSPPISNGLREMAAEIGAATVLVTAYEGGRAVRGTGLVIGRSCLVVTSYALVKGAQSVMLTLSNGVNGAATVLGADPATGIAVLHCPATQLPALGTPSRLPVNAHELVALVVPSQTQKLDFGFVNSAASSVTIGNSQLLDEILTDIPENVEGTALVGYDGQVVGLVVGAVGGTAVATPTWLAMAAARQIATTGKVESGVLGIRGTPATGEHAGVDVLSVTPRGAAWRAGIKSGDVIESVDGTPTVSMASLKARLHCLKPGTVVDITLVRHGVDHRTEAVLLRPAA